MDVSFNDLRQLMRQYANQLGDLLREIKRIHAGVVEGVSATAPGTVSALGWCRGGRRGQSGGGLQSRAL